MIRKFLAALVLAAVPALWASGAQADLLVEFSIGGGPFSTICTAPSGTACAGSVAAGGFVVTLQSATSNSPGTPTLADILSGALSISNTNASGTTASIELLIGDTGYTAPTTVLPNSLLLASHIGGTVVTGDLLNTLTYVSCVDQANGQNVCPGTLATAALSPDVTSSGSFSATNSAIFSLLSAPFSMTEQINLTLSGGSTMNYSASSQLAPVPEPVTMFLGGTGLLGLALAARRRLFGRPA